MRIAYIDCIAGASGDMLLGCLIAAGVDQYELAKQLESLGLAESSLRVTDVLKNGFAAKKVDVMVDYDGNPIPAEQFGVVSFVDSSAKPIESHAHDHDHSHDHDHGHNHQHSHAGKSHSHDGGHHHHGPVRHYSEIVRLVNKSSLSDNIKEQSIACLRLIGEAEAKIHNQPLDKVHLHEVGGVDAIIDVVGTILAFEMLGVDRVVCSPLPLGRGFVDGAHGKIPLPAPAAALILDGVPVYGVEVDKELVTPTGAALVKHLADDFGAMPDMKIVQQGCGAGTRDLQIPNIVRLFVGEGLQTNTIARPAQCLAATGASSELLMLESDIDDMTPEQAGYAMEMLQSQGALDVTFSSVQMKKNRPGFRVSVLCELTNRDSLLKILFVETSTFGVREIPVTRHELQREIVEVKTEYGKVRVKHGSWNGATLKKVPEYEDCAKRAREHQVAWRSVYEAALRSVPDS